MMPRTSMAALSAALLTATIGCDLTAPDELPQPCGGAEATACPWGYTCQPDPDCDPATDASCPAECVPTTCGGIVGNTCSKGHVCVDDAGDSCDPKLGGADCLGRCVPDTRPTSGCDLEGRTYVAKEKGLCEQIQFLCEPGWIQFYDHCGCGCKVEG